MVDRTVGTADNRRWGGRGGEGKRKRESERERGRKRGQMGGKLVQEDERGGRRTYPPGDLAKSTSKPLVANLEKNVARIFIWGRRGPFPFPSPSWRLPSAAFLANHKTQICVKKSL
jgi:hypothetical protein